LCLNFHAAGFVAFAAAHVGAYLGLYVGHFVFAAELLYLPLYLSKLCSYVLQAFVYEHRGVVGYGVLVCYGVSVVLCNQCVYEVFPFVAVFTLVLDFQHCGLFGGGRDVQVLGGVPCHLCRVADCDPEGVCAEWYAGLPCHVELADWQLYEAGQGVYGGVCGVLFSFMYVGCVHIERAVAVGVEHECCGSGDLVGFYVFHADVEGGVEVEFGGVEAKFGFAVVGCVQLHGADYAGEEVG